MRNDIPGSIRKRILAVEGIGIKKIGKGTKHRKTVFGNTISAQIVQINMKVIKEGKESLIKEASPEEKSSEQKADA
jgi:small subunit ribosomal protein S6e